MHWTLASVLWLLLLAGLLGGWPLVRGATRRAKARQRAAEVDAERRQRRLEALAQVTLSLSQQLDPDRLLQQITDALAALTSAHNVVLWEVDREAGLLVRRAWTTDASIGALELPTSLTLEQGGTGWIARHREPLFVADIATDRRIMASQWALGRDLVAFAGVPVAAGDDLLGVLTLNLKRGSLLEGADRTLLHSFAAQAAVAMRNARLFADNRRLYEEARQRLGELQDTQAQLLQAGKLSAVGQLVSGVAHELNNPLSVVIGYGQLLLTRGLPADMRRPVELIVAQGGRMARIIQGLLLFSRQRKPERRPVDLRGTIGEILGLRETQLTLSNIRVETELGADVPPAEADPHQLRQVFLNLILNAEQAIVGSGVGGRRIGDRIHVSTSARREAGVMRVIARVADNGPGIPAAALPRVFEPFFTTKKVGEGAGLGLSVSYGIAVQHGGRLSVESAPGRTVFTLELPAAAVPESSATAAAEPTARERGPAPGRTVFTLELPAAAARESSATAAAEPTARERGPAPGQGRRALVVDDEPDIVEVVMSVLDREGWRVDVAPGGHAALERLLQTRYDLILSDVRMPEMDGPDFYRAAVAQHRELAQRFLFITGDVADPEAWQRLGMQAPVLEKPFTPQALLRAVEQVSA